MTLVELPIKKKSPEVFDTILRNWTKNFLAEDGLKVAIARKGPRLLELCLKRGYGQLREQDHEVISHHALPFVLPHYSKSHQPITLADEAIYFGSTYEVTKGSILAGLCMFNSPVPPAR